MRIYFVGILAVSLLARQLPGQSGQASPPSLPQVSCPPQGCNVGNSHVVHISSSSNVRLENGVLHYVTGQVLQNNGGDNAEVIWTLPLPPSSAFHNLTMSFDGEMLMGEIYARGRARAIYDAIVATKKDPALVEWTNRDLLTTRIYPILPAETKYLEMRLQAIAKQTANVIRIDYFAGSNYARHLAPEAPMVTMTFSYPDSVRYGVPYSSTHVVSRPQVTRGMRTVTVSGQRTDVSLLLPVTDGKSGSISVLPHAVAGEDGYVLLNIIAPVLRPNDSITDMRVRAFPVELKEIDSTSLTNMHSGESRVVALRYRGSGVASITVSGIASGRNVSWTTRAEFPRVESRNAFAARLFATEKIGTIDLRRTLGCAPANADSVITALGFRHSIPSPMTSYLVLEPSVRIDDNGQVTNASDFATKNSTANVGKVAPKKPAPSKAIVTVKARAVRPGSGKPFTLSGVARDAATGAPLSLVSIQIDNSATGATTDSEGRYTIEGVPPGVHNITAMRIGYSATVISDLPVAPRDAFVRDITLNMQALILSGVVTTGLVDPTSGTRAPFSVASDMREMAPLNTPLPSASVQQRTCNASTGGG